MSRLDAFVQRVTSQRAFLNEAVALLEGIEGVIFEVGLGNGRTFDHLRDIFPDREIYVFDKTARAHASSTPDPEFLIEGQLSDTLPEQVSRFRGHVALVHSDIGNQSPIHCQNMAGLMNRTIVPALCPGGIILSDLELDLPGLALLEPPKLIGAGWYNAYRLTQGLT
jgi:hypothetical protein